jgi:hypothetical protein
MMPDGIWCRPLNVPRIEALKFQSAQARSPSLTVSFVKNPVPWMPMLTSDRFYCAAAVMDTSAKTLRTTTARFIEYFSSMLGLLVISAMPFLGFGSGSGVLWEVHRSHD